MQKSTERQAMLIFFLNGHKLRIDTLIMEIEWWFLSLRGTKD